MKSKIVVAAQCVALSLCVSLFVGCKDKTPPPPPAPPAMTPARIKEIVALLDSGMSIGPFGVDVKAGAAEKLGGLGQAAKDAGAIPALTKLSKSGKATPEAKAAAVAALAKLNAAEAPAP